MYNHGKLFKIYIWEGSIFFCGSDNLFVIYNFFFLYKNRCDFLCTNFLVFMTCLFLLFYPLMYLAVQKVNKSYLMYLLLELLICYNVLGSPKLIVSCFLISDIHTLLISMLDFFTNPSTGSR